MKNFTFSIAAASSTGTNKKVNQDCYVYQTLNAGEEHAAVLAVADGVGGMDAGDKASSLAIASLNTWWETAFRRVYNNPQEVRQGLEQCMQKANRNIWEYARQNNLKMGTTLSVLLLHKEQYHLVHVGDSRIYKMPHGLAAQCSQLTQDHAVFVKRSGAYKWQLTQCLGHKEDFEFLYAQGSLKKGDRYLLCTDGVYKTMPQEKEIAKTIKKAESLDAAVASLINSAKQKGETDDVTAILTKVTN